MGFDNPRNLILLLIVVIVLFGAKRLPDSAKSLGKSLRIFKSELKGLNEDEKKPESDDSSKS
jgi:sec-independent protein translocase protein TatA